MRRSAVLSLPLQSVFPGLSLAKIIIKLAVSLTINFARYKHSSIFYVIVG
jgi:hypothetical protein